MVLRKILYQLGNSLSFVWKTELNSNGSLRLEHNSFTKLIFHTIFNLVYLKTPHVSVTIGQWDSINNTNWVMVSILLNKASFTNYSYLSWNTRTSHSIKQEADASKIIRTTLRMVTKTLLSGSLIIPLRNHLRIVFKNTLS